MDLSWFVLPNFQMNHGDSGILNLTYRLQRVSIKVPQFNEKYYKYMPVFFVMFEYIFLKYI